MSSASARHAHEIHQRRRLRPEPALAGAERSHYRSGLNSAPGVVHAPGERALVQPHQTELRNQRCQPCIIDDVETTGDQVAVTSSIRTFLEVLRRGVNKGQALQHVMRRYEIDLRDVVAFGDGLNDLEMLQEVGLGVAMENAYQELKVAADDIAPHHQRGGVGLYLQRLLDRLNQG